MVCGSTMPPFCVMRYYDTAFPKQITQTNLLKFLSTMIAKEDGTHKLSPGNAATGQRPARAARPAPASPATQIRV